MNSLSNCRIVGVNVNSDDYLKRDPAIKRGDPRYVMSQGELMKVVACPGKWLRTPEDEDKDTEATRWGSLLDCLALSPKQFDDRFIVRPLTYPDTKTGEPKPWSGNSNWCKNWMAEHDQITVIKQEELDAAKLAHGRLQDDARINLLLTDAKTQVWVTGEYQDRETGLVIPCRGLIDIVPNVDLDCDGKCLADLKTTRNANHRAWARDVYSLGYHVQAAFYLDLYVGATGEDRIDWLHVLSESEPPYEVGRRLLSSEFVDLGRSQYLAALQTYCRCLKNNHWPGYDDAASAWRGWTRVDLEEWMVRQSIPPDWSLPTPEPPAKTQDDDLTP